MSDQPKPPIKSFATKPSDKATTSHLVEFDMCKTCSKCGPFDHIDGDIADENSTYFIKVFKRWREVYSVAVKVSQVLVDQTSSK